MQKPKAAGEKKPKAAGEKKPKVRNPVRCHPGRGLSSLALRTNVPNSEV